ncbi:MAG TPA: histidine kinase dimerization/phospho-acceptor domain-containing protein, partial [Patescibacteria group bacterium]|nr:histidine kinase dimerization/phospho-acceptor domain-containing protein [Patescibacteria group bacterium]
MRLFQDVPIRKKLRRITMLTTIVALLLTGVALIIYELVIYRSIMTRELMSLADVIGANSAAALTFNDSKAAEQTLAALRKDARITLAVIFTKEGNTFAVYRRRPLEDDAIPAASGADGGRFEGRRLIMFQPIILDHEKVGTVYIQADTQEAYARLQVSVLIVCGVLLVSSLVALFLASTLEGVIARPIINLAQAAAIVSEKQDYSVRVAGSGQDELGLMIAGFNEMLAQIQRRDVAIQEARDRLEAAVEERTRELQEAKHLAEEASRHKSLFLSNMSHELRTPLNSIIGFASILQDLAVSSLREKELQFTRHISESGEHLLALINDVLDLSKVEAGKLLLQPQAFPLREAIEAAVYTFRPQAKQKQQVLELSMDHDLPIIKADPIRFRQILYNMLSNAVKFTPAGGRITVTAKMISSSESGVSSSQPKTQNPIPSTLANASRSPYPIPGSGSGARTFPNSFSFSLSLSLHSPSS